MVTQVKLDFAGPQKMQRLDEAPQKTLMTALTAMFQVQVILAAVGTPGGRQRSNRHSCS
jgi:hypothetical protein